MHLVIFDDRYSKSFFPITLTRSVGDLRCGILKLRQRLEYIFAKEDSSVIIDPRLFELYSERHPDWQINSVPDGDKLYINSRLVINEKAINYIQQLLPDESLVLGGKIVAVRTENALSYGFSLDESMQSKQCELSLYKHIAELIHDNSRMLNWDFEHIFYEEDNYFETEPGVSVLNPYQIWLGEDVQIAPNVVLDASDGPIVIDNGARIMAGSVLCGPLYIGKKSIIKISAKIYGGVSIGPVCKIGGEVEGSIIQGYSNKQHDGFLGHAYLGEWVNLGADTNNSDLKNTYSNVNYYNYMRHDKVDSGVKFLGCIIGDHSKTGINTSLNTGLVIGCGCNIYGSSLFKGFVPDFSWGEAESLTKYRFTGFCDTAAAVKQRRNLELTDTEIKLYSTISGD